MAKNECGLFRLVELGWLGISATKVKFIVGVANW
jgi:hypothetical protein